MIACTVLLLWLKRLFTFGRQKAQLSNTESNLLWHTNNFFPKDSPIAQKRKPLGKKKNFSLRICLFIYLLQIGQTRKTVFGARFAKEHFISGVFFGAKWFLSWPVENICFSGDFSRIYFPSSTQHWNFSLYSWCLLWDSLEVWVALCKLESNGSKRKKAIWFSLIWWNDQNVFYKRPHCL